jgi:hypothetical protein
MESISSLDSSSNSIYTSSNSSDQNEHIELLDNIDEPDSDIQDNSNNLFIHKPANLFKDINKKPFSGYTSSDSQDDSDFESYNVHHIRNKSCYDIDNQNESSNSEDYYDNNSDLPLAKTSDLFEDKPKSKYYYIFSNIFLIKTYLANIKLKDIIISSFILFGIYSSIRYKNLMIDINIYKDMELKNILYLLGPLTGLGAFLAGTFTMNGIYFRPNSDGKTVFTIDSLKEFITSPFQYGTPKFNILWANVPGVDWKTRLRMLQLNWVAMLGLGLAFSMGIFMLL